MIARPWSDARLAVVVWLAALAVLAPVALAFPGPGFMDAYYYYHVGLNLARGHGFVEQVIWTYLTDPAGIPQPSNLYWMPLTSVVAAPFLRALGDGFRAAQLPFLLLSALVPAATAVIARRVTGGTFRPLAAAALTLFAGYYFVYWVAVDAFAVFTLAAGATFLTTAALAARKYFDGRVAGLALGLGVAAAAAHLARADGPLLLTAAAGSLALAGRRDGRRMQLQALVVAGLAYLAAMAPWFLRNLAIAGTPLPGGGTKTLFLREYNEIFSYGLPLTLDWYLGQGLAAIVEGKLLAAVRNLGVLFGLEYWLVPFAVAGWWHLRRDARFTAALIYGGLLYLAMTLVFTFPSGRGSMLHSSVALLPWLAIAAVLGIERSVGWAARRLPHWNAPVATRNFTLIFVLFSAGVSIYLVFEQAAGWEAQAQAYHELLPAVYVDSPEALPMVLNPPGWWYVARRPAIQVPSNGPDAAIAAAERYGATHLLIEPARARDWGPFVTGAAPDDRFELVLERDQYRLYRLRPAAGRE